MTTVTSSDKLNWWRGVLPHVDIREQKVNETLFAANLGQAVHGEGPEEYREAEAFFAKTYLTHGLRELLVDVLHTLSGRPGQNPVANLQTSFGGGKTHSELAIYHLLQHSEAALRVRQVRDVLDEAGLEGVPPCRVAVLPCSSLNALGRTPEEGVVIRTLWGEMAYQLGGKPAYDLVAANDAQLVAPGEEALARMLKLVGPAVLLFDETLHYVDKVSSLDGARGSLARNTVAFLRELTVAVDMAPRCMLVVSLTASRMDALSQQAMDWLQSMNKHVNRVASARTPIEGSEIHEIVRQRLFERVDESAARQVAQDYRALYAGMSGLPTRTQGDAYQRLLERSYPFHPELVTVLYERWGSKPGFQLTRGTLRFLALALQPLWAQRNAASPELLQPLDLSLEDANLRAIVREVAGEGAWESVLGSDVAGATRDQPAKAQRLDRERKDGQRLAEGLATTILLYSLSGGENPHATRDELRLACARRSVLDAAWDDALDKLRRQLFYLYHDGDRYQFRKEPNVLSLQQTYRTNLQGSSEIDAYLRKSIENEALGSAAQTGFTWQRFSPEDSAAVPDDDELKLVVLDFRYLMQSEGPSEAAREVMLDMLRKRGQVLRQYANTLVFCLADAEAARLARDSAREYLSWRKIEQNANDWERIGGAQQALVKEQRLETEGATKRALISAYSWAMLPTSVPTGDGAAERLDLHAEKLGTYGPGKLVVPMVWERLTSEKGHTQPILVSLTPETLLQRYARRAWPESETWLTTLQLWERFTRQVGLPLLAGQRVLLDTLALGQREGFFAIGHLNDDASPRDQRDSYLELYYKDKALPPNVPGIGERWLLLRPAMYEQIESQPAQVSPAEVGSVIDDLRGESQSVSVGTVYKVVKRLKDNLDDASFQTSLVRAIQERRMVFRLEPEGENWRELPREAEQLLGGCLVLGETTSPPAQPTGRTITVKGTLRSLNELAPLFRNVLQPLNSQGPKHLTIAIDVTVQFETDPGAGFDAALADGFRPEQFPGLALTDSKGK